MFRLIRHITDLRNCTKTKKGFNDILQPPHLALLGLCGCGERWPRLTRLNFTNVGEKKTKKLVDLQRSPLA